MYISYSCPFPCFYIRWFYSGWSAKGLCLQEIGNLCLYILQMFTTSEYRLYDCYILGFIKVSCGLFIVLFKKQCCTDACKKCTYNHNTYMHTSLYIHVHLQHLINHIIQVFYIMIFERSGWFAKWLRVAISPFLMSIILGPFSFSLILSNVNVWSMCFGNGGGGVGSNFIFVYLFSFKSFAFPPPLPTPLPLHSFNLGVKNGFYG